MLRYFTSQTNIHSHNFRELSFVNSGTAHDLVNGLHFVCMYAKSGSQNKCDVLKARTSTAPPPASYTKKQQNTHSSPLKYTWIKGKSKEKTVVQSRCHCAHSQKPRFITIYSNGLSHLMANVFFNLETTFGAKVHVQRRKKYAHAHVCLWCFNTKQHIRWCK